MNQPQTQSPAANNACNRLVLVDGSGYLFRAYHALPPLTRPDGTPVGAVYGYTTMLMKLREQFADDCMAVIFDASRDSFRTKLYVDYKANRPPPPEDLLPQFALVREATRAMNLPCVELEGFEADDLIASYARTARAQGREVVIVSSDKDLMQLVGEGVSMLDPMKQKTIGREQVIEKFGVPPEKVREVQALIGDAVDNVPGVPSIGPKTAAELINQYGTLEGVLANLDKIKQPKRRQVLTEHAEAARLSYKLVALDAEAPLPAAIETFDLAPLEPSVLESFLQTQGFKALLRRLGMEPGENAAPTARAKPSIHAQPPTPATAETFPAQSALQQVKAQYDTIRDEAALIVWIEEAIAGGVMAFDTETTSLNAVEAELVGIALATAPGKACYIPLAHTVETQGQSVGQSTLFDTPSTEIVQTLAPGQLPMSRVFELVQPVLSHPGVLKIGHNLKYDLVVLAKYGVTIAPLGDTMLMSYCLNGGLHGQGLDLLAEKYFSHKMTGFTEITGTGKAKKLFSAVDIAIATAYAAEDADYSLRLYELLKYAVPQAKVATVYDTIERPLIPIIAAMEVAGIRVDTATLAGLSGEFAEKLAQLEKEIIALAGHEFSVGSPKQLGEVLFEKMGLSGGKKSSKSGAYTTDAETLEGVDHPIAAKVLEWRQFAKLKSTYTDTLAESISASDERVHTCYSMAATTTGRLSSSDPNLQNIPIRTEEGRRIRTAFVAPPGFKLISADYSQIELRLLAHVAGIEVLKEAFRHGTDIHAVTASQMFGVPVADVSGELRRRAKTINFGIIYGISAHGLATRLSIPRTEAAEYIGRYFEQYPGIREYMDSTIAFARAHGYVETLYGRKVHVKDINSKNGAFRQFSERAAINAPLQGTAADIIKRAMVAVDTMLGRPRESGDPLNEMPASVGMTKARLLLQVHDELVVEAPEAMAETLVPKIKRAMEQVAHLSVPLTVDVGLGNHWGEIH